MPNDHLLQAGARLAEHLRRSGIATPMVGAGSNSLFVYLLKKDMRRIPDLTEWEGIPVQVRPGGKVVAYSGAEAA